MNIIPNLNQLRPACFFDLKQGKRIWLVKNGKVIEYYLYLQDSLLGNCFVDSRTENGIEFNSNNLFVEKTKYER